MAKSASYAQWSLESYSIGLKLRALRTQKRLTLARLAAETGLSTALLSKLETDRMVPTLPTLATISRAYGVGMSHFFAEPAWHSLSITRKAHFEAHERGAEQLRVIPLNAVEPRPPQAPEETDDDSSASSGEVEGSVHPEHAAKAKRAGRRRPHIVAQMIELPIGGTTCTSDCFHQHSGLMYVLEGQLQLDSGALHELLHAGDCAYIESDMALAWSAAGKRRCRVLAVFPGAPATES
jgi:transcriptional regulator with XRE-family HTH domain